MGSNERKALTGKAVAKIVVAVNEWQRGVDGKKRKAAGCGMLPDQNTGPAKIVEQLQENMIIPTMEVVGMKIPVPGSAENG